MLIVTGSAETYDLVRLDTVRAELGVTVRAEDENLARWIAQASSAIAKHLNRALAIETVSETFRLATRNDDLLLSRFRVASVVSVVENGETLAAADYELHAASGLLTRLRGDTPTCWPRGKIVVEYVAGYALDDVPEEIARAAMMLVSQYRYGSERDPQLRSESTEGAGSSSYFDGMEAGGLSPEVRGLLAEHRKPAGA